MSGVPSAPPIHRHFLGWEAPALESASRSLLEFRAPPAPSSPEGRKVLDLSGLTVVVPGGRAGRLLLERLVALAEARDAVLRPPEIAGAGSIPERFYTTELPAPDPVLERLVWIRALRATDPDILSSLVPDPPSGEDHAGWDALAAMIVSMHHEVGAEVLTFRAIAESCREGLRYNDEARWEVLSGIRRRALSMLREMGFMDREEARRRAIDRIRSREGTGTPPTSDDGGVLVLLALAELPGVSRGFLRRPPPGWEVHALVHAPGERAGDFDAFGCVIPERWQRERLQIPERILHVVDRPGDQADRIVRSLAAFEGRWSAEEITVGVPDPELVPFLADRLEAAGIAPRPAEGRPMEHTSIARLLVAIGALLRNRDMESLAAFVRHPAVEPWISRTEPELGRRLPMVLDRYQSLHLQRGLPDTLPSGGERRRKRGARSVTRLRERVDALLQDLGGTAGTVERPLSRWPERLRALLLELLGPEPLHRSVPTERETLEALGQLEVVLRRMEGLPSGADPGTDGAEFLRFLVGQLRGASIPPLPGPDAVELLGWLEIHLDDAPVLLLAGVNEPHLPEALGSDPFLPNSLRTRLGLPDNRARWARDVYRLKAILHSRERLEIVAGRRTGSGDPLRLSRLLLAEESDVVARRILAALGDGDEGLASDRGGGSGAPDEGPGDEPAAGDEASPGPGIRLPPEPVLRDPRAPSGAEGTPAEVDGTGTGTPAGEAGPRSSLSVTAFRSFLRDPYAWGLRVFRGLDGEDDRAREMDPAGFGTLAHDVLERWGRIEGMDRMGEGEVRDALLGTLERTAEERFGDRPLPAVRIQIEQMRARLRAVAEVQAHRNADGWRIVGVEAKPPDPGVPFPVDGQPFHLRGRIDRVDHHPPSRTWALLDYKTSDRAVDPERAHRKGRGDSARWVDLQLPLYRHFAPVLEGTEGLLIDPEDLAHPDSTLEVGYFLVPADLGHTGVRMAQRWTPGDLASADEAAREVVRRIRSGVVRWDPDTSRIRQDDPLGPVVGAGTLRLSVPGVGR